MPTPCHVALSSRTSGGSQLLGESLNSPTWNPMLMTLVCLCLPSLPLYFSSFHACIPYSIQPYALFVGSFRFRWIPSTLKARTHSGATRDTSLFQQMDHQSCRNSFHRRELRPEGGGEGGDSPDTPKPVEYSGCQRLKVKLLFQTWVDPIRGGR